MKEFVELRIIVITAAISFSTSAATAAASTTSTSTITSVFTTRSKTRRLQLRDDFDHDGGDKYHHYYIFGCCSWTYFFSFAVLVQEDVKSSMAFPLNTWAVFASRTKVRLKFYQLNM